MLDLLLTPLSAMSISPVRNSMNSSRAASSPSDLDVRKVSWVSASEKSCFLELNRHRAAVLVLRPLQPGVCQLGDLTGRFLPRDGRTGLKLITESGVKRRSTSARQALGHNVRGYGFVTLLTQLQSRVPSRTPAIFHKNTSNFSLDQVLVETKLLLTLTFSMGKRVQKLLIYIFI